ncbi:MAG TPA: DNA polymerase ligase N-terminal domain-containing protein [bacterium]|nr:DNA polymerase ligase N-terminal domain-containing protein [bacterium]
MSLREYRRKRRFAATPEPRGGARTTSSRGPARTRTSARRLRYVIHKHHARTLHYDLRLEWHGVLLSWAVPKGPSLDPSTKRLAVRVEDHPLEYGRFEGRIPEGEYGAGTVAIWDEGTWRPDDPNVDAALRRGELAFTLQGRRLTGRWVLVRTRFGPAGRSDRRSWLLMRRRDPAAGRRTMVAAPGSRRRAR